jgi:hypothetical protein
VVFSFRVVTRTHVDPSPPRNGKSSCCIQKRQPPDIKDNCRYTVEAVMNLKQCTFFKAWVFGSWFTTTYHKNCSKLQNVTIQNPILDSTCSWQRSTESSCEHSTSGVKREIFCKLSDYQPFKMGSCPLLFGSIIMAWEYLKMYFTYTVLHKLKLHIPYLLFLHGNH